MEENGIGYAKIGYPTPAERTIFIKKDEYIHTFDIDTLRDTWYKTSYLLDRDQSFNGCAAKRRDNYKKQPVEMQFHPSFKARSRAMASLPTAAQRRASRLPSSARRY